MAAKGNWNIRIFFKNVWNFSSDADTTKSTLKALSDLWAEMPAFICLCRGTVHATWHQHLYLAKLRFVTLISSGSSSNTNCWSGQTNRQRQASVLISNGKSYIPMPSKTIPSLRVLRGQEHARALPWHRLKAHMDKTSCQSSLQASCLQANACCATGRAAKHRHLFLGQLYLHNTGCYEEKSGLCKLSLQSSSPLT